MESQPDKPEEQEEESVVEETAEEETAVTRREDEPLTSEEIRNAATDLYTHAKNVWLRPVRKEVRSWFKAGREFLGELGGEKEKRDK